MFRERLTRLLSEPVLVFVALVLLACLGAFSLSGLQVGLFPPLNFPVLSIVTEAPGYSSLEMERQVVFPLESAISGVLGVTRVRSVIATGISDTSAEFAWGTNMLAARQLVEEALAQARGQLPPEAEPSIENLAASLGLIEEYSLKGKGGGDLAKLRDMAQYQLKPKLQGILGVYKIVVMAGRVKEISVDPNPFAMIKYGVTLEDLASALQENNILASPGLVNRGSQEFVLYANGQLSDPAEVGDVVIAVKNGLPVRLRDVAKVSSGYQVQREDASEDGEPAVLVAVYKQPQFGTVDIAEKVSARIAEFRAGLPKGYTIHNFYDQAQLVSDSIGSVKESVEIGALFVVLVLALFLRNWRLTLIAAVGIPVSLLAALILMRAFHIGVNIMSLGGLAVGSGIIVDNVIIVLENIYRFFSTPELSRGKAAAEVVVDATDEVLMPVFASTMTNIAIFAPMVLIAGFAGRLFQPVAITITFALLASLVVALTVTPVLYLRFAAASKHSAEGHRGGGPGERFYLPLLRRVLARPWAVLGLGALLVAASYFAFQRLDLAFLPDLDEGAVLVSTDLPPGTSLAESRRENGLVESWLRTMPDVLTVVRHTGHAAGTLDVDSVNHSDIMVKLAPKSERAMPLNDFLDALAAKTASLPNMQVDYLMPLADKINDALGGIPFDLGVDLYGPDLGELRTLSGRLVESLQKIPGVAEVRPPQDIPIPALQIKIRKREAGRLGISTRDIFDLLKAYSLGLTATRVQQVFKSIGVVLHLHPADRDMDLEALRSLPLRTAGGNTVPLEQVADVGFSAIPNNILHDHQSRKVTVAANVRGRNIKAVAADAAAAVRALHLPPGYSWGFSGKYRSESSAAKNMELVFLLAVGAVALLLWLEFRSWIQTGLILLTIPLAAVGAFFSLWAVRETLNVSSMLGIVLLVGIVVRNGILLVDYANLDLAAGTPLREAVETAALKRARPILMTATVMMLGLLPVAFGWGTGSELLRPLGVAVMGGILTSTALTLLILPAAMVVFMRPPSKKERGA
ncbi:MAG: efflux RND transporter permease subunit [Elusimicrobia bacterium]|nr:efflux RND transporter permease subunit [Elusimicrobiota bacterium]